MKLIHRSTPKKSAPRRRWAYYAVATMQVVAILASSSFASADSTTCTDPTANPLTSNCLDGGDLYSINTNTPNYEPRDIACSSTVTAVPATLTTPATGSSVIVPPGQDTGTWTSGLTPPYIYEQFMIELLKDIAKKHGVPESDAVTQQHVIALIAFAWIEGGGVTNNNFWNPFNTGLKADDLVVPGTQSSNGSTETFKSFDAGVEATARVMTNNYQGRLGVTLIDPNSTATDFLNSWLDFSPLSEGHYPWAEASDPSSKYYQPSYKQDHIDEIAQVAKNYDSMASLVMRGQTSDPRDGHDTTKLHFHTNGSISTGATPVDNPCGNTGTFGGGNFSQTVRAYAWPTYHQGPYCLMMPAYSAAIKQALKNHEYVGGGFGGVYTSTVPDCSASGDRQGIDCGGFVTRVYRDSKADPNYNSGNGYVPIQYDYVTSHPTLYKRVTPQPKQSQNLQPGDIYFEADLGHTYLYVGKGIFPDPQDDSVSASVSYQLYGSSWRTPMASPSEDIAGGIWYRPLFSLGSSTAATTLAT